MSLIIPKKQILYSPMLGSLGGGSVRGFGRGVGGVSALDWTFVFNHTSGTAGRYGLSYSELNSIYSGSGAPFANDTSLFNVTTAGYQDVLIQVGGNYSITATGGSTGGNATGAVIPGVFDLAEGSALRIIVGSSGTQNSGAGGSFVFYSANGFSGLGSISPGADILVAAGGAGGKNGTAANHDGSINYLTTTGRGNEATNGSSYGTNGQGAPQIGGAWSGGGGAGILGAGSQPRENGSSQGVIPEGYEGGFAGGDSGGSYGQGIAGFGGGARGSFGGGGGGGYSGGSGQYTEGNGGEDNPGGGGGSYIKVSHPTFVSYGSPSNSGGGNGTVVVTPA